MTGARHAGDGAFYSSRDRGHGPLLQPCLVRSEAGLFACGKSRFYFNLSRAILGLSQNKDFGAGQMRITHYPYSAFLIEEGHAVTVN